MRNVGVGRGTRDKIDGRIFSCNFQQSLRHTADGSGGCAAVPWRKAVSAQTGLETALLAGRPQRGIGSGHRLWLSITGSPEVVSRREHPVVALPVLPRPRHDIGQPVR
jgi:hypothetical protein